MGRTVQDSTATPTDRATESVAFAGLAGTVDLSRVS